MTFTEDAKRPSLARFHGPKHSSRSADSTCDRSYAGADTGSVCALANHKYCRVCMVSSRQHGGSALLIQCGSTRDEIKSLFAADNSNNSHLPLIVQRLFHPLHYVLVWGAWLGVSVRV